MSTDNTEQGTHFWTMAIQARSATEGLNITGAWGTWTPKRGQTRYDVFNDIRGALSESQPETRGGVVIAFDIQPNKL